MRVTKDILNDGLKLTKMTIIAVDLEVLCRKDIEVIDSYGMNYLYDIKQAAYRIIENSDRLIQIELSR